MKIKIADMIYVLDIQNKNKHINSMLEKYNIDPGALNNMKTALRSGRWKVSD